MSSTKAGRSYAKNGRVRRDVRGVFQAVAADKKRLQVGFVAAFLHQPHLQCAKVIEKAVDRHPHAGGVRLLEQLHHQGDSAAAHFPRKELSPAIGAKLVR